MESFIWLAAVVICYFAPTFAAKRGRRGGVLVINLFLGWTVIGWIVALFIAIRSNEVAS